MGFGRVVDARGGVEPAPSSSDTRARVLVMGVVNMTPDSFSDGGRFVGEDAAVAHAEKILGEGADIVDFGAESTRPRAEPVSDEEQIRRIGAAIARVSRRGGTCSIDTTSPIVAAWAIDQGAILVNSVSLAPAADLGELCARARASLVLMHARGSMGDMAGFSAGTDTAYADVVADVAREWLAAADHALAAGIDRADLWLDPGLGFHKNARQSLELCSRLDELVGLGFPVVVGASRKSFLARAITGEGDDLPPPEDRLGASIAAALISARKGAHMVRVHDVRETRQALAFLREVEPQAATPRTPIQRSAARDPELGPIEERGRTS